MRLVTWNVRGQDRPDLRRLAAALRSFDPDVVALQEVRAGQATRLARALGIEHHRWLRKHNPFAPFLGTLAEGLAVLSRFPVVGGSAAVLTPGASTRSYRRRVMQEVVVRTPVGTARIANVHLSSDDDRARAEQAERVARLLEVDVAGVDRSRTVLAGDLNCDDDPSVFGPLAEIGLLDAWTARAPGERGPRAGATNPAGDVSQRLDHVLVGADVRVSSVDVPQDSAQWAALSDHLPVVAELRLA
jgi:endonuclease/exonuclease/phosphatase family metal-dependent hydrolase